MIKDKIQTDVEQRQFKTSILHELDRIANALERLASCEEKMIDSCSKESTTDEEIHDFRVQTGSLQP